MINEQYKIEIKNIINEELNKPLEVEIKYHDSNMPKLEKYNFGNWIDCRVVEGGNITHENGIKEMLLWKIDDDGKKYIEYKKGDFMMLSLGISLNQGKGYEVNLVPRSSTFKNFGIIQTNHYAVGDDSFIGDKDIYHYPCYALRNGKIYLYDRVCQMRINKSMNNVIFKEVDKMNNVSRGSFGSSGKNEISK